MSLNINGIIPKPQEDELNSTALFLSLYLVMLAFFILLNAISHRDGLKTGEVVSSVNTAFKANHDEQNFLIKKSVDMPVGDKIKLGGYFAPLGEVISKSIKLISKDDSHGNVLQAVFPASAFFVPKKPDILVTQAEFIAEIADNIKGQTVVEISLESKGYANAQLPISRLIAFTSRLEKLGVDPANIYVGVVPGSKDQFRMRFSVKPGEEE